MKLDGAKEANISFSIVLASDLISHEFQNSVSYSFDR